MKSVDTEYPYPDPLQSYVPGENDIIAASADGNVPHGFQELGRASRHIFGHGACDEICSQMWVGADMPIELGASYVLKATWYVPVDEVFDVLEVDVYYTADVLVPEMVKFILGGGGEVKLDGVASAGATLLARKTWSTSDIELVEDRATITMYLQGLGASGNTIQSVHIRRVAPSSIADGTYYGGNYVPPDDLQTDEDEYLPLAEDILDDLAIGLQAIHNNRRKLYASWAHTTTISDGGFALLAPYSGYNPTLHVRSSSNQSGACLGGRSTDDQDYRTVLAMDAGDIEEIEVVMDPIPHLLRYGQFYLTFDAPDDILAWTIEGV